MAAEMSLIENKRVMFYRLWDPLVIEEILACYPEDLALRNQYPHVIHTFVDLSDVNRPPTGLLRARHSPEMVHPRSGQIVVVGASPMAKVLSQTIFRAMRFTRAQFYDTEAEGWAYLQEILAAENRSHKLF